MSSSASAASWQSVAIIVGRLIFAAIFIMAAGFKFAGMDGTAAYIAAAGIPASLFLAWVAAIFESLLALGFLTGAFFSEVSLLAAAYVLFLAIAFHGPSHWAGNQSEFGFFVDHFTFIAGLLFAAVNGPGQILALRRTIIGRPQQS
jgi:putative oxidoreductase